MRPILPAAAVAAVALLASCKTDHEHGHPHEGDSHEHDSQQTAAHDDRADHTAHDQKEEAGHGHGENAIGITRWTEQLELFAEHPPAVTGQELPFLAHLTLLEGFRPVENATVTLALDGPVHAEARVTEKLRSGIFQPTLTAPTAGTYRGKLLVSGPQVQDTIGGFEVVVHPSAEAAQAATSTEEGGGPEPIPFLKEQQWQVPFATAFAEEGSIVPSLEVAGEVTTPPSGQAEVGAGVTGRVVAPPGGLPRPGQTVRRGELLATIAPAPAAPEAAARADLAVVETQARLEAARATLERAERLIADQAIPQRQVDEARRELRVAEQAVQAAQRARSIFSGAASGSGAGTYRVTAPIGGAVVEIEATAGKSVQVGSLLFKIVDLRELWIRAHVPEQQAALIVADQDAAYQLPGIDTWFPLDVTGEDAQASVVNVGRTVHPRSRTVEVLYALREPEPRLRVGAMVRVAVPAGEAWQGVVVPREAVLDDDGRSVVYVQVEGEAFEERAVRLGPRSGASVGMMSGVRAGERVVTVGANVVRLTSRAGSAPAHGHVH